MKGTLSQLKNKGGFRIIQNKKVIDAIMDYDGLGSEIILNTDDIIHYNHIVYDNEGRESLTYATSEICSIV